ncbi:MAG: type II secretion system GspH family protein [bacterium]|nr:type II secretion system GspH family protein [bacterium]
MNPSPHRPRCRWPNRPSFTLVELLVAIAILGTLAGLALFSLLGAQTDARVARTRGTIQKLNEIVLQRWEEYRYRPINVQLPPGWKIPVAPANNPNATDTRLPYSPRELARLKMIMLRDTMRMEMPDRISDLLYEPTQYKMVSNVYGAAYLNRPVPTGWSVIYDALRSRVNNSPAFASLGLSLPPTYAGGPLPGSNAAPAWVGVGGDPYEWNEMVSSAELLYLIVASSNYNGSSGLEFFRPSEVGDTDNDGLLEFIDAWRQPIQWIRWPAGYRGDLVRYADSDAMDPLRTDWRFRTTVGNYNVEEDWKPRTLVPLILSPGQDGQLGVIRDRFDPARNIPPLAYATMRWPTASAGTAYGAPNPYYAGGPYYYPDPNFTWEVASGNCEYGLPNGPGSEKPFDGSEPCGIALGFRANQLGAIPNVLDANGTPNDVWSDNITNHDIILEP